jgi:hypothetical protein
MPPLPWRTKSQPAPGRSYLVMASWLPLRSRRTVPNSCASPCQSSASWNAPRGWSATPCSPNP